MGHQRCGHLSSDRHFQGIINTGSEYIARLLRIVLSAMRDGEREGLLPLGTVDDADFGWAVKWDSTVNVGVNLSFFSLMALEPVTPVSDFGALLALSTDNSDLCSL